MEEFEFENGWTMKREDGHTPNGNDMNLRWVLRTESGEFVDVDTYRNDIIPRHSLVIKSVKKP